MLTNETQICSVVICFTYSPVKGKQKAFLCGTLVEPAQSWELNSVTEIKRENILRTNSGLLCAAQMRAGRRRHSVSSVSTESCSVTKPISAACLERRECCHGNAERHGCFLQSGTAHSVRALLTEYHHPRVCVSEAGLAYIITTKCPHKHNKT